MAVAQQFCKSYCENYCFTSGAAAIYSSHLSPNAEETTRDSIEAASVHDCDSPSLYTTREETCRRVRAFEVPSP